jgi:hypothetical protein
MTSLDGLSTGLPFALPPLDALAPAAAGNDDAPVRPAEAGLRFDGWAARPGQATILGDVRQPGPSSEHRAIAQSIAALLFDPIR